MPTRPLARDATTAALESGAGSAAVIGGNSAAPLQQSGYGGHMLADLSTVQLLYTGLAVNNQELAAHRDRVKRFLYATVQGREYDRAFRGATIQIIHKYTNQPLENDAVDYETSLAAMTDDGTRR